jgi:hypothetical protein
MFLCGSWFNHSYFVSFHHSKICFCRTWNIIRCVCCYTVVTPIIRYILKLFLYYLHKTNYFYCCILFQNSFDSIHIFSNISFTLLQAGRSTVRVPDEADFFNLPNPSSRTIVLESTQPLTEPSTRNLAGGKKRPPRRADNLAAIYEPKI